MSTLKSGSLPISVDSIWDIRPGTDLRAVRSRCAVRVVSTTDVFGEVTYRNAFGRHGPERRAGLAWFVAHFQPRVKP